jgi:hypothetical protein
MRARERAPAMAVIARMKFPAFAAKKNSTCSVAYVICKSRWQARVGVFYARNLCILEITCIIL